MAHRYAYQEDEPLKPMPEDTIFKSLVEMGKAKSTPITEIKRQFHKSVNDMLSVNPGPALEGPLSDEEIQELAADWAEGEIMEAING